MVRPCGLLGSEQKWAFRREIDACVFGVRGDVRAVIEILAYGNFSAGAGSWKKRLVPRVATTFGPKFHKVYSV